MSPLSRFLRLLPRRRHFSTSLPPSNPNHSPQTLHSLYHERDLDRFLSAFHRLSPLPIPLYAVAVRRLDAAGRPSDAAALLRSLQDSLPPSDESSAASLISLYGKARLPDLAVDVYRRLPSLGTPRTVLSFNCLLASLDPDRLIEEFNTIPAEDPLIVPNVVSYSTLLRAMCRRGDLDGAIACLGTMEEKGVMPNDVTYNTVLSALYKNDRAEEAEGIWGKMEERKCGPNVKSYNAKLRWLVSKGRMADAVRLFREMEGRGLKPDGYSFTAMIMGHCQDGKLNKAKRMLTELRMRNRDPTPWMYDALVPRMCEAGDFEEAVSLCNESMRNKCYMGVGVLQGVVDRLVEASRVKDAMKIVQTAWSRHYSRESLIMPPECLLLMETEVQEKMQHEALKRDKKIKADLVPRKASGVEGENIQNESVSSGASAKIGIIVKSFDKPNYMGAFGVPPDKNRVKLPTTRTLITVLRSPHIDKKSREQFEMRVRREYIVIKCRPHELHKKYFWFKRTRILGAQFELVFSYKTRLDMSKLTQSL